MATGPTLEYQGRDPAIDAALAPRVRRLFGLIAVQGLIVVLQLIEIVRFDQHISHYMPTMGHDVYGNIEAWCFGNLVVFGAALAQLCVIVMAARASRVFRRCAAKGLALLAMSCLFAFGSWWLCLVGVAYYAGNFD